MFLGNTWFTFVVFSLIVVVALLGNSLVIYVLVVRRKKFLNKPYSVFILNLAIVDFLTAIFLIISRFLYLPPTPTYNDTAGEVFCQTIWSGRFAFDMGYISVYTCLALTIERWFAVVKPTTYRSAKSRHAVYAVILVWFIGPAVNCSTFFRIKYNVDTKQCTWTTIPFAKDELPWISLTVQSIIPYTAMVVLYSHIYYALKKLPRLTSNRDIQLRRITVVALLACSLLILGWVPGRITFMLTKFGLLDPNGSIHFTCVMITFLNSCVNPFLYGIYSPAFRAEYKEVFHYYYRKTVNVFHHNTVKPSCDQEQSHSLSERAVSEKSNSYSVHPPTKQDMSVSLQVDEELGDTLSAKIHYNQGYTLADEPASMGDDSVSLEVNENESNSLSVKSEYNQGYCTFSEEPASEEDSSLKVDKDQDNELYVSSEESVSDRESITLKSVFDQNNESAEIKINEYASTSM